MSTLNHLIDIQFKLKLVISYTLIFHSTAMPFYNISCHFLSMWSISNVSRYLVKNFTIFLFLNPSLKGKSTVGASSQGWKRGSSWVSNSFYFFLEPLQAWENSLERSEVVLLPRRSWRKWKKIARRLLRKKKNFTRSLLRRWRT